jgi:hypothetical protein
VSIGSGEELDASCCAKQNGGASAKATLKNAAKCFMGSRFLLYRLELA